MATFAKSSFNASVYSLSRPTYPAKLFEYIFKFHGQESPSLQPQWRQAVDLGCGTGKHRCIGSSPCNDLLCCRDNLESNPKMSSFNIYLQVKPLRNCCGSRMSRGSILHQECSRRPEATQTNSRKAHSELRSFSLCKVLRKISSRQSRMKVSILS